MRSILYIYSNNSKTPKFLKALSSIERNSVISVNTIRDSILSLNTGAINTIFIDLEHPIAQIEELLNVCKQYFTDIPRIAIRGCKISVKTRKLLELCSSSFQVPTNQLEFELLIYKLNKQFPIEIKKKSISVKSKMDIIEEQCQTLFELINNKKIDLNGVIRFISKSILLSNVILSRINSPYYELTTRITSIDRAFALLGIQNILDILKDYTTQELEKKVA